MSYRLNYGNGQVWPCSSKREAEEALKQVIGDCSGAFIQRYVPGSADEPGEWRRVK